MKRRHTPDDVLIEVDEAIQLLENQDPVSANLVKLRFFAGLTRSDASASQGLTRRQGDRLWAFARAWLFDKLRQERPADRILRLDFTRLSRVSPAPDFI